MDARALDALVLRMSYWRELQATLAAIERLDEYLDALVEQENSVTLPELIAHGIDPARDLDRPEVSDFLGLVSDLSCDVYGFRWALHAFRDMVKAVARRPADEDTATPDAVVTARD